MAEELFELSPPAIREALVGRTITDVVVEVQAQDWPQGDGDLTFVLDNGRRLELRSWGYDAWGLSVHASELADA